MSQDDALTKNVNPQLCSTICLSYDYSWVERQLVGLPGVDLLHTGIRHQGHLLYEHMQLIVRNVRDLLEANLSLSSSNL